ncbi:hypothetical protein AVEN_273438-1 [Araneus ventricosus]|uniref:Uncharacterized protein n=1 Tax=Araneus ventricosus TaxID=182803 RepID=A0A4Y2DZD0_ARAVE|nr:hypothetical protein AVEN_273438-1 [Araneus ventricosus]
MSPKFMFRCQTTLCSKWPPSTTTKLFLPWTASILVGVNAENRDDLVPFRISSSLNSNKGKGDSSNVKNIFKSSSDCLATQILWKRVSGSTVIFSFPILALLLTEASVMTLSLRLNLTFPKLPPAILQIPSQPN